MWSWCRKKLMNMGKNKIKLNTIIILGYRGTKG